MLFFCHIDFHMYCHVSIHLKKRKKRKKKNYMSSIYISFPFIFFCFAFLGNKRDYKPRIEKFNIIFLTFFQQPNQGKNQSLKLKPLTQVPCSSCSLSTLSCLMKSNVSSSLISTIDQIFYPYSSYSQSKWCACWHHLIPLL